ncbi:hypothetical protein CORC01_08663 [Colletotrichum orchidophilum]|uniref:Uncharacterized protein n=1 Tax=Colletotrichum orchidophilum TaxID=1209926 RepID=A0A1G4B3I0_9PEZI|nr:uncharacterized protein CORC01_08663 [Colletotrichum orchidophilum]OHE95970.1 hypothetical protein CORC01_08663 [Colletotrichum orchidophilum]
MNAKVSRLFPNSPFHDSCKIDLVEQQRCSFDAGPKKSSPKEAEDVARRKTCGVKASGSNTTDDAPAIVEAFKQCGRRGRAMFEPTTYYGNSAVNATWLEDAKIDLQGILLLRHRPTKGLSPRSQILVQSARCAKPNTTKTFV